MQMLLGRTHVFFETISNPTREVIDTVFVVSLAYDVALIVIVDNVFLPLYFQM